MEFLILAVVLSSWLLNVVCNSIINTTSLANLSNTDKDMYVINAMVYQVGILTNKTDKGAVNTTGNQESVTFYHTNGTKIDLSKIPEPLLTNVTAQSIVGLAPAVKVSPNLDKSPTWSTLSKLASSQQSASPVITGKTENFTTFNDEQKQMTTVYKRSLVDLARILFKRDLSNNTQTPVKIVNGAAIIPSAAGVQSIAIPPLLVLNNNLSTIPVPIPNTSIVHYAKINTVVRGP